jgi:hypothetical protein
MSEMDLNTQQNLVGKVLGKLEPAEQAAIEAQLQANPRLSTQIEKLEKLVAPLAAWTVEEPAPDLADRIMARVQNTTPLKYVAERVSIPPERQPAGQQGRRIASLNEWVALAACLAILVGIFFPGLTEKRDRAMQMACSNNLAQFGGGINQYAAMSGGSFPQFGAQPASNWLARPNRNNLTPVFTLHLVIPTAMFCPTTAGRTPNNAEAQRDLAAFLNRSNVRFYSTQYMYGQPINMASPANTPFAADPNPMFEGGAFAPSRESLPNSRVHNSKGQNTLFLDGSVRFLKSPVIGEPSDNIWQAEDVDQYTGTETPTVATDAFLIP